MNFYGDSNTRGFNFSPSQAGPRGYFFQLRPSGFVPVGTLTDAPPPAPTPAYWDQHDGHSGDTSALGLAGWASRRAAMSAAPDLVFVHLGSNDALTGVPAATTAANLAALCDAIHATDPQATVYLSLIINLRSDQTAGNAIIDAQRPLVAAAVAGMEWVVPVTMSHVPDVEFDDYVHLLGPGCARWAADLAAAVP